MNVVEKTELEQLNIKAEKILKEAEGKAQIVAATKTQAAEIINLLPCVGITKAGENRVQEFLEKYPLIKGVEWHFIGRLQTNKVKYIVDKVSMIQSVDRAELAAEIQKQCLKRNLYMDVLIELNLGEESKGGVAEANLKALADAVKGFDRLRLKGLMCIPPENAGQEHYAAAQKVYQTLKENYDGIEIFSMGMSGDYTTAIKHGANIIRPGTALFGSRAKHKKEEGGEI